MDWRALEQCSGPSKRRLWTKWVIVKATSNRNYGYGQQWIRTASIVINVSFATLMTCCVFITTRRNWWRGSKRVSSLRTTIYNLLTYILGPHLIIWSWTVASIVGPCSLKSMWNRRSQILKRISLGVGRDFCQNASCRSWEIMHLGWRILWSWWRTVCNDTRNSSAR